MLKVTDTSRLNEFGFAYEGNYNRGDNWVRYEEGNPGDGIIVQGAWAENKISYLHPYKDIDYPPIENYIQDLITPGIVVKE